MMVNSGDKVGICQKDDCGGEVQYIGDGKASCQKCGALYEIEVEDEPQSEPEPQPEPEPQIDDSQVAKPLISKKTNRPLHEKVGDLVRPLSSDTALAKSQLRLDSGGIQSSANQGIPKHVKSSRAWKWAQQHGNTGNPYKEGTKSWHIFNHFEKDGGITVGKGVQLYVDSPESEGKMSAITLAYDVIGSCICAGLLVKNEETRKITVCKDKPKIHPMP